MFCFQYSIFFGMEKDALDRKGKNGYSVLKSLVESFLESRMEERHANRFRL